MKNIVTKTHISKPGQFALSVAGVALFVVVPFASVSAQTTPAPTPAGVSFDQRLAQRKAERNVAVDEKTQKRIISTCTNAQGDIRALQQKTTPALNNRNATYQKIDAKLWITIGKLKLAKQDTFNLEKQRIALAEKASSFQSTGQLYQQVLDDLVVVNCQADPIGFKALLDTARIYRGQLRDQATEIKGYIVNDVKSSLSNYANNLKVKPSTEGDN